MKTTRGSFDEAGFLNTPQESELDDLDTLLAHAPRYTPPADFAERVLAALHEEEAKAAAPRPRPWYLRPYTWAGSAAAACLTAIFCLLTLNEESSALPSDSLAVDDALLVEEALDAIDDPDLVSAICSVSSDTYGSYSDYSGY